MENASKALLIAGGFLITILLLTLFSYLYTRMAENTAHIQESLEKHEISEFNQQFLNYEGRGERTGSTPLTSQDVATLINLAKDNNENQKFPTQVAIYLGSKNDANNLVDSRTYIEWLDTNKTLDKKYKCTTVHVDAGTLLVDYVIIVEIIG